MIKLMMIGKSGCGKTTFIQAIKNKELTYKKTQAIEVVDNCIDTPGEFLELRPLYRALVVTSVDCDVIMLCQDCSDERNFFPPGFCSMFNRPVIGLVTKTDLAQGESISNSKKCLELAGATEIYEVSSVSRAGIEDILKTLEKHEKIIHTK